jgi:acetyl-CoA acyltransferase
VPEAVLVAALRTPVGTAINHGLFSVDEHPRRCVATVGLLGLDPERVNVNGSGCSLGHPVAATGARMLVTLVHELRRRGGGMRSATVIEVPAP